MKKTKNNERIIIVLAVALMLLLGFVLYSQKNTSMPQQATPVNQTKLYQSKNLKFSISLPINFTIKEMPGRITIENQDGTIYIDRNSTNFGNLKDYLQDLDSKNKVQILKEKNEIINGYQSNNRTIKFGSRDIQKTYSLYIDGWIYNIYSNSEDLFNDLDQIAQFFRYTP